MQLLQLLANSFIFGLIFLSCLYNVDVDYTNKCFYLKNTVLTHCMWKLGDSALFSANKSIDPYQYFANESDIIVKVLTKYLAGLFALCKIIWNQWYINRSKQFSMTRSQIDWVPSMCMIAAPNLTSNKAGFLGQPTEKASQRTLPAAHGPKGSSSTKLASWLLLNMAQALKDYKILGR